MKLLKELTMLSEQVVKSVDGKDIHWKLIPEDEYEDFSEGKIFARIGTIFDKTYADLLRVFKRSNDSNHKSHVIWNILFSDKTICSIYDYDINSALDEITEWSIGGNVMDKVGVERTIHYLRQILNDANGEKIVDEKTSRQMQIDRMMKMLKRD